MLSALVNIMVLENKVYAYVCELNIIHRFFTFFGDSKKTFVSG